MLKYERCYPDHQAAKVFNDLFGFRTLCDNYENVLQTSGQDKIRVADMFWQKVEGRWVWGSLCIFPVKQLSLSYRDPIQYLP